MIRAVPANHNTGRKALRGADRRTLVPSLRAVVFAGTVGWSLGPARAEESKPEPDSAEVLIRELETLSADPETVRRALIKAIEAAERRAREQPAESADDARRAERIRRSLEELHLIPPPNTLIEPDAGPNAQPAPAIGPGQFTPEIQAAFARRFSDEIWPLLTRDFKDSSCLDCHGSNTKTPLAFLESGESTFQRMLRQGYFEPENPAALLAKISAPTPQGRMPPEPAAPLPEADVAVVRRFADDLFQARQGEADGPAPDERFPVELLEPYVVAASTDAATQTTPPALDVSAQFDSPFLSYFQLRRKVQAIFGEGWTRDGRNLFRENIAQFGGADFQRYFSETSRPSATYMAALNQMAADVVSKAYLNGTGPFAEFTQPPDPPGADAPEPAYAASIAALYQRLLFRDPTEAEAREAYGFVRSVFESEAEARANNAPLGGDQTLDFELTVRGRNAAGEPGEATRRRLSFTIRDDTRAYHQASFAQNRPRLPWVWSERIGGAFNFKKGDPGQCVTVSNLGSSGTVTFAGVEIVGPLPFRGRRVINIDDPAVQFEGSWTFTERGKVKFVHDGDENKGQCVARARVQVPVTGRYEVYARWIPFQSKRKKTLSGAADRVFVEVVSAGAARESRLILPEAPPKPPAGEAHFIIDQTIDTIPHVDFDSTFRFDGPDHGVIISNAGTSKRVTADAVTFVAPKGLRSIDIDNNEADGKDNWPIFTEYPFRPYNIFGADCVNDRNERKGELTIRFDPARREKDYQKEAFYGVQVTYPGQVDNETRAPVIVRAAESSPIVVLRTPPQAPLGAEVVMDASASYDIQGSALEFQWKQVGGPLARLDDPTSSTVRFVAGRPEPAQRAWEGLARALMSHPDFVFTRPPSLRREPSPADRARLLLTRIAQDLAARPPTPEEFASLESGEPIEKLIDAYLESEDFKEFYFRRVRLYLESHGTPVEDEPVRLWTHVAFNDKPFQEILTADYSVNEKMEPVPRPAYHGRSGLLTMRGFIQGKPGLPHFNYAAQVAEKFLGYVFEVPPEIVQQREGITAISTTNPGTVCYSCHKTLTPLAFQRLHWDDNGAYRSHDDRGVRLDASDNGLAPTYPYRGEGMEGFATRAVKKERFIRTMIDTHVNFFFGRSMRFDKDERDFYKRLWDAVHESDFKIKALIRAILTSPEYRGEMDKAPRRGTVNPTTIASGGE